MYYVIGFAFTPSQRIFLRHCEDCVTILIFFYFFYFCILYTVKGSKMLLSLGQIVMQTIFAPNI